MVGWGYVIGCFCCWGTWVLITFVFTSFGVIIISRERDRQIDNERTKGGIERDREIDNQRENIYSCASALDSGHIRG